MIFNGFCSAAGTYGLAKLLPQTVYAAHSSVGSGDGDGDGSDGSDGNTCHGADCFRLSHLVIAALAFSSVLVSYVIVRRTRGLYRVIRANACT
jgi:hypothetical protein